MTKESPVERVGQPGGCLCGAVRFETSAPPVRITQCYCRFCQRATGSTHMVEPIFRDDDFKFSVGAPTIYSLSSTGSGKRIDVHFCSVCGTKVCLTFERFPGVVGVYAGTFDDPSWFARTPEVMACLFTDSAMPGTLIPSGVPVFRRHRTEPDGSPAQAEIFGEPVEIAKRD